MPISKQIPSVNFSTLSSVDKFCVMDTFFQEAQGRERLMVLKGKQHSCVIG